MSLLRLVLAFFFLLSFALAAEKKPVPVKLDTGKVHLRKFDQLALKNYKADREFNYREKADVSESWWDRFWRMFWDFVGSLLREKTPSGTFFKYFFIALGIGALVFAGIKLAGMDAALLFTGKSKQVEIPYTESLENIHEISFDIEIEKALLNNNFRVAVRLEYLKCLKKLNDSGTINWEPGKTNSAYISEIPGDSRRELFESLTRRFEYIWYGNFPVDRSSFSATKDLFIQFYRTN